MPDQPPLTIPALKNAVCSFAKLLPNERAHEIFGVTDGKKIGTWMEVKFNSYLSDRFGYSPGSAASGIDFPSLGVDLKTTSAAQPQSSSPFRSPSQKVYGLGHDLLVIVYTKIDDHETKTASLAIPRVLYICSEHTGDYQTTRGLLGILERDGDLDDVMAFLEERTSTSTRWREPNWLSRFSANLPPRATSE